MRGGLAGAIFVLVLHWLPPRAEGAALQNVGGAFSSGKAYVSCVVDGAKEKLFLDTGSAMTLLKGKRYLAYTDVGDLRFKGAAGIERSTEAIRVGSIRIDNVTFTNVKVAIAGFAHAENTLGIDLLGRQAFSMSFGARPMLNLNAEAPAGELEKLGLSKHGVLVVPARIGEVATRALWDTGAGLTFVDAGYVQEHPKDFLATKKWMKVLDGSGKPLISKVYRAQRITVGGKTFKDVNVVAGDMGVLREHVSKEIDMVIGFNLIRQANWYFDAQRRLWKCTEAGR